MSPPYTLRLVVLALVASTAACSSQDDSSSTPSGEVGAETADETSLVADSGRAEDSTAEPDTTRPEDSTNADSTVVDTSVADTSVADTSVADTSVADTSVADTFVADTSVADTFVPDVGTLSCDTPPTGVGGSKWYGTISAANVYAAGASGALRSCFIEYSPAYPLWTDGLNKRRWIYLPAGTKIETGPNPVGDTAPNMDRWVFPIGTRFLKEFARASDGKKLETRIWERTATGYRYGAFRWRADQTEADYTETGGPAALPLDDGTTVHEIPSRADCGRCHDGEPGKGLGFSAVTLSKAPLSAGDLTLVRVIAKDWLSHPPSTLPDATLGSPVPGSPVEAKALGYLHANCGHCHNPLGQGKGPGMWLRIRYGETNPKTTELWATTIGKASSTWAKYGATLRIDPGATAIGDGAPALSTVYLRPTFRSTVDQMPTIGTALVDTVGMKDLEVWIKGL